MIGVHSVTMVTGAGLFVPSVDLGGSVVYVVWQGRKVTQREHTRGNTIETRDLVARAQLLFRVPKIAPRVCLDLRILNILSTAVSF